MGNEVAVIRDYDIRDKKLVDATAQSTINSTDAIEMKTTDGNQVFIDKASFIKAVGQAFTASDPKTFTKLLGMNGDGPMGIGASDLASVLGVRDIHFLSGKGVNMVWSLGTIGGYDCARVLGAEFTPSSKPYDITIYGNGANAIVAKASQTTNVPELYVNSRTVYIRFPVGRSFSLLILGNGDLTYMGQEIPSGASRLEIGTY